MLLAKNKILLSRNTNGVFQLEKSWVFPETDLGEFG